MRKPIYILGLSCFYHDAAAVLLRDGSIVFAAQEERYTRKKHDENFPKNAIEHALRAGKITATDLSEVVFYEKPFLKFFERILETQIRVWPRGFRIYHRAMREWMTKKLWIPQTIKKELCFTKPILFTTHHESHAASAYCCSGFPDAAIVTIDGVGEWATTTIGYGKGKEMQILREIRFPHSLGLLYSALTYYLGFKVNSAEYKVMGLAPYGEPKYMKEMRQLIDLREDGSFELNMSYFTYEYGLTMTGKKIEQLFGQPARKSESVLEQFHKDIAASLQKITEEAMMNIAEYAKKITGSKHLCLAGGCALNAVANGKILRSGIFEDVFIQPAAGDSGGALGAALAVWHKKYGGERLPRLETVYLGDEYSAEEIECYLRKRALPFQRLQERQIIEKTAELLAEQNVIGWFQGRMEYGPRSLGNRSILADARNKENLKRVNLKIKFRESFRPFAPTVLAERAAEYFELDRESPFMLLVANARPEKRIEIPAVTHIDGSARIQTVREDQNPKFYRLLKEFDKRTGCAVLLNTSFNVRDEPIVESPEDALHCFLNTEMDYLVLGHCLLSKEDMPKSSCGATRRKLDDTMRID